MASPASWHAWVRATPRARKGSTAEAGLGLPERCVQTNERELALRWAKKTPGRSGEPVQRDRVSLAPEAVTQRAGWAGLPFAHSGGSCVAPCGGPCARVRSGLPRRNAGRAAVLNPRDPSYVAEYGGTDNTVPGQFAARQSRLKKTERKAGELPSHRLEVSSLETEERGRKKKEGGTGASDIPCPIETRKARSPPVRTDRASGKEQR
jgi:hypothetical protein